jgi:hypothetical protein
MNTIAFALLIKISVCMAELQSILPMSKDERFHVCSRIVNKGERR